MWKSSVYVAIPWIALLLLSSSNFFFWDTVQLASKQAHFFYENNFSQFFLPQDINSGHPPFYGIALALFWKVFTYELWVGHLFNGLFVLGVIFQSHLIGRYFVGDKWAFAFPLVLFCNPIFLGHSLLVSPDNPLIFLFLLSINGIISRKPWLLVIGTIFLVLVSMRGMMVVISVFIANLLWKKTAGQKVDFKDYLVFVPAGICALTFLVAHYFHNKWVGFHNDSPWKESFNLISYSSYFKNLFIIAWRLIDFGNVFTLFAIGYILYDSKFKVKNLNFFGSFILALVFVFVIPLAAFKYLTAHRYFMPIYLIFTFAMATWVIEKKFWRLGIITLVLLFAGNWWIYPRSISQGWDVSLGHLPFYSLVEEMNAFVKHEQINPNDIGTEFPIKSSSKYLYLDEQLPTYQEAKVGEKKYILYSKVINDYKIEDFEKLEKDYFLIKDLNYLFVDLKLYEQSTEVKTGGTQ